MESSLFWREPKIVGIGSLKSLGLLIDVSIILFLIIFVGGCAKKLPTIEPADLPVSLVVQELEQRADLLSSFRAVGSIRAKGEKQRWSGRAFFLSQLPDSLRLEVVSFFGQPVLYVTSDGHQFLIWQPGSNRAYQGLASDGTLGRLIEFPLHDREALLLLAGIVTVWDHAEAKLFRLRDTGTLLLQLEDTSSRLTQKVWLNSEDLVVTKIERIRGRDREFEAIFSDFMDIEGYFYPRSIVLEGAKARLNVRYEHFSINENLDERVFHLALPEEIEIIPW